MFPINRAEHTLSHTANSPRVERFTVTFVPLTSNFFLQVRTKSSCCRKAQVLLTLGLSQTNLSVQSILIQALCLRQAVMPTLALFLRLGLFSFGLLTLGLFSWRPFKVKKRKVRYLASLLKLRSHFLHLKMTVGDGTSDGSIFRSDLTLEILRFSFSEKVDTTFGLS